MQYLFGAAIFIVFMALAFINRGSPLLTWIFVFFGVAFGIFAGAGRSEGDRA